MGGPAVLDVGIERRVGVDGIVIGGDLGQESLGIDAFQLAGQFFQAVRGNLGDAADAVFVAQHGDDLGIEHLPGELVGLVQDFPAVFRIGVVPEIRAFVDEALAVGVDHDAPGIGMLLKIVADGEIPEFRRIVVPAHRMATRPVAVGRGADIQRHADAVAGVEAGAAYLGQFPARPQIACAPFQVGLETATGQDYGLALDVVNLPAALDPHAGDRVSVESQIDDPRPVSNFDTHFAG